ncbi:Imm45 family immunity protein [Paracidovorax oryzae]|uniref:Imm45 family immunity protein n=1 Tax=Paracidovorax oryzae TaxID=862720 RepID=UPI0012ECA51A|nr:Imm45 family immunity protein [Paracidovorax oryzae]
MTMDSGSRLLDYTNNIERGKIIRCHTSNENCLDFMVIELHQKDERRYALLNLTGYKAGLIYAILPQHSQPSNAEGYAIDKDWLISNWIKWGYFDCPIDNVYVIENL